MIVDLQRGTGRTTRAIDYGCKAAVAGKSVLFVASNSGSMFRLQRLVAERIGERAGVVRFCALTGSQSQLSGLRPDVCVIDHEAIAGADDVGAQQIKYLQSVSGEVAS